MRAYLAAHDLIPSSSLDLGDLRKPILDLPDFMTVEWVGDNIRFTPDARWAVTHYASEIREETGAPIDEVIESGPVSVESIRSLIRYPLFLRAAAARCSGGDPINMGSLFSIVGKPVRRFVEALAANADMATSDRSTSALGESVVANGTPEEVEAAVQMFALCALLIPFVEAEKLIERYPDAFGTTAAFIREANAWIGAADRMNVGERGIRPSWELFRDYHVFVPNRKLGEEYRKPLETEMSDAVSGGLPSWVASDTRSRKALRAVAPGVAADAGMPLPDDIVNEEMALEFLGRGAQYPLFWVALACRMSLVDPEHIPTWHLAFRTKAAEASAMMAQVGNEWKDSLADGLLDSYPSLDEGQKRIARDWLVIAALTMPTDRIIAFVRSDAETRTAMGPSLSEVAERRFRSLDVEYAGPDFAPAMTPPSETSEVVRREPQVLN